MGEDLLTYDKLSVAYRGIAALREVSFSVMPGEAVCVVGESGSGKSTLLRTAIGLLSPGGRVTHGTVRFRGCDVTAMTSRELQRLRGAQIGFLFQDCRAALTPVRRVGDQLVEAVRAHACEPRRDIERRACELLERMNVADPERVLASYPHELSGGLGQRAGIAIALVLRPRVMLVDEPTSALDAVSGRQVIDELVREKHETGTALVVVTHNIGVARALADEVVVLHGGVAVESGAMRDVLEHPECAYTRELIEAVRFLGDLGGKGDGDGSAREI